MISIPFIHKKNTDDKKKAIHFSKRDPLLCVRPNLHWMILIGIFSGLAVVGFFYGTVLFFEVKNDSLIIDGSLSTTEQSLNTKKLESVLDRFGNKKITTDALILAKPEVNDPSL